MKPSSYGVANLVEQFTRKELLPKKITAETTIPKLLHVDGGRRHHAWYLLW